MKTTFNQYTITAKLKAQGVQFPFEANGSYTHNKFSISVKNTSTGQRVSFDYYGSEHDYTHNIKEMNEGDLKQAFYCLISDSVSSIDGFENFCSEFGYDSDSRTAERIFKACEKQYNKAIKLVDNETDLYDLANELND